MIFYYLLIYLELYFYFHIQFQVVTINNGFEGKLFIYISIYGKYPVEPSPHETAKCLLDKTSLAKVATPDKIDPGPGVMKTSAGHATPVPHSPSDKKTPAGD